jgi:hypothetical protein
LLHITEKNVSDRLVNLTEKRREKRLLHVHSVEVDVLARAAREKRGFHIERLYKSTEGMFAAYYFGCHMDKMGV